MSNTRIVGKCSLCGGRVLQHTALLIVGPMPPAECERCHAVEDSRDPVIPMRPRTYGETAGTFALQRQGASL